jgi:hypothetical protein
MFYSESTKKCSGAQAPHFQMVSIAIVFFEALLLHGETRPLTCLPARATSAASSGAPFR